MAEKIENQHPQQPPLTENGLARMNEWLANKPKIKQLPQPNINRLFLLRELREAGHSLGYREKTEPKYTTGEDKNSDILMDWDTLTDGDLKLKLQLNDLVSTIQTQYTGTNPEHYAKRFINEIIGIRNQLKEDGINIAPTLINAYGNVINLPEKEIKQKEIAEPKMPPKVPLGDQELSLDVHTGAWYGSPKKQVK